MTDWILSNLPFCLLVGGPLLATGVLIGAWQLGYRAGYQRATAMEFAAGKRAGVILAAQRYADPSARGV